VLNRATEAGEVALIVGDWNFDGTGPDGEAISMSGRFRDVLHCQATGRGSSPSTTPSATTELGFDHEARERA